MRRCLRGPLLSMENRSPERVTQRNGYRSRAWDTRVGLWSCTSRSFERGATSRACWSHGVAASELCWR